MSEEEYEMEFGWIIEHCMSFYDEVPQCPTCGEGHWHPVGIFTSREKVTEWMDRCGYEEVPEDYRILRAPLDDAPVSHTSHVGFIPDHIAEEDIGEYIMQDLENRDKFQEDNV